VFLLDDHELVRRGIRDLLSVEDDLEVVGEASTAAEALTRIPSTRPDVAVLDVRLGEPSETSGIEVCRDIRAAHPEVACVMLTSFGDDTALFASIMAGASGYLLKQIRGEGKTNREIAAEMFLAEKTIKNYVSRMLDKLGMKRRSEAAAFAARLDVQRGTPE
jgi:DNA-binding NarL/FixJ family response regulator